MLVQSTDSRPRTDRRTIGDEAMTTSDESVQIDAAGKTDGLPALAADFVEQDFPETIDNIVPTRGYQMTPMVGLGGSAGSIHALSEFFRTMPADSGMVFVVILHLSPTHESTMPELLGRATAMTVVHAEDGQKVGPESRLCDSAWKASGDR